MELAVKAMTERLVEDFGGWVPLTMRAWRKYTRRKLEKKRGPEAAARRPRDEEEVAAEPARVAWAEPEEPADEPVEAYGDDYSDGKLYDDDDDDDGLSFEVASTTAAATAVDGRPPRPKRRMSGVEREEAIAARALLQRRRDASATYFLHQRQSETTRNRSGVGRGGGGGGGGGGRAPPSKRFAWLDQQGVPAAHAEETAVRALADFPALRCLEVATGFTQNLFAALAASVFVVEFYLSHDRPRTREPVVAVDP